MERSEYGDLLQYARINDIRVNYKLMDNKFEDPITGKWWAVVTYIIPEVTYITDMLYKVIYDDDNG